MDPATEAALGLAVVPLIFAAIGKYRETIHVLTIFARDYKREVDRFQTSLKVKTVRFENECRFLLHSVTSGRGNVMVEDLQHPLWQDPDLKERQKAKLNAKTYDACASSLRLIRQTLEEILKDTCKLEVLVPKV